MRGRLFRIRWIGYCGSLLGTAAVTALLIPFRDHINATTVALAFLLVVLFVAILAGSRPAILASVFCVISFNFFFIPPIHTFTISDPQNWVALAVFFITALTVGQLSARARHRAREAEAQRSEIKRLYEDLQEAFDRHE